MGGGVAATRNAETAGKPGTDTNGAKLSPFSKELIECYKHKCDNIA